MKDRDDSVRLLDPKKTRIRRDSESIKLVTNSSDEYAVKRIVRTFPITMPWRYIALFDEDDNDLGIIEDTGRFDKKSVEVLKEELERVYFLPLISKLYEIKEEYGVQIWDTDTNKGPRTFEVIGRQNVRKIGENRVLIRDADGNLYDIPDLRRLDDRSKSILNALT